MFKRIATKIHFTYLKSGIRRFSEWKKIAPFDPSGIEQNKIILKPFYDQYIKEISRPDMAASLELAAFLMTLCKQNRYTRLLDMGSGFSSFVFRMYAKEAPGVRVCSVDDDEPWLEKTKLFLQTNHLNTDAIFTLDHFLSSSEAGFDLILHDLNFVEVRINYVAQIMTRSRPGGWIVFDDVHKPDYLFPLLVKLESLKAGVFTLKPVTFDLYRRFSLAAVNPV